MDKDVDDPVDDDAFAKHLDPEPPMHQLNSDRELENHEGEPNWAVVFAVDLSQIVSLVTAPVILSIEYITSMVDFSYFCTAVILDEVNAA